MVGVGVLLPVSAWFIGPQRHAAKEAARAEATAQVTGFVESARETRTSRNGRRDSIDVRVVVEGRSQSYRPLVADADDHPAGQPVALRIDPSRPDAEPFVVGEPLLPFRDQLYASAAALVGGVLLLVALVSSLRSVLRARRALRDR